jgi:hypothetical protein
MAKSKKNVITYGLSGKIGDILMFRQVDGQTIVSSVGTPSKTESEKQVEHRKRFQQAVLYARIAIASPETEEQYRKVAAKKKKRAFNVAVADFFNAPGIESIDLSEYGGNVGDRIRIIARDDFAVKTVTVRIINPDGSIVEEGNAVQSVSALWIYTATQYNESLDGDKIIVTASDLPGNKTEEELIITPN